MKCSEDSLVADQSKITVTIRLQTDEYITSAGHASADVTTSSQTNSQRTRNKSSSPWSATGSINLEDLEQRYGMRRSEAAESLGVSVSTLKRICREKGLPRWPTVKRIRENALVSESPNAIPNTIQLNEASEAAKENNRALERASTEQEYMDEPRKHKRRRAMLPYGNPTPNALAGTSQLPENGMMSEDGEACISRQERRRLERNADNVDERTHVNRQSSEIVEHAPKRQAVDRARKESTGLTAESASGRAVNQLDSEVQHSLGDTSARSLNSISCNENTTQNTKHLLGNLIALPLEALVNPENEASMRTALSILADNLSSISEEQAKQFLELKFDFPVLLHSWREFSRSQMYNQEFLVDLEKTRELVKSSMKDEENLKTRYEELECKEEKLMAQLDAVLKEKAGITQQMHEKLKQTKHFVSLAEEKAAKSKEKIQEMRIAATKLNSLVDQWAKIQSLFI